MQIKIKIQLTTILFLILSLILFFIVTIKQANNLANELMSENLLNKLKGDINSYNLYVEKYYGKIIMKDNELYDINGNPILNNFVVVDKLKEDLGVYATIFKSDGDDFTRVSTNIITQEGKRAVGTKLGKDSAAYKPVKEGKLYIGKAYILGKPYFTTYNPIYIFFTEYFRR